MSTPYREPAEMPVKKLKLDHPLAFLWRDVFHNTVKNGHDVAYAVRQADEAVAAAELRFEVTR